MLWSPVPVGTPSCRHVRASRRSAALYMPRAVGSGAMGRRGARCGRCPTVASRRFRPWRRRLGRCARGSACRRPAEARQLRCGALRRQPSRSHSLVLGGARSPICDRQTVGSASPMGGGALGRWGSCGPHRRRVSCGAARGRPAPSVLQCTWVSQHSRGHPHSSLRAPAPTEALCAPFLG